MLRRIWRLLDRSERRELYRLAPLVLITAGFELVGVTAVIPFVTLLANPAAVFDLPIVGEWVAASGIENPTTLLRYAGVALAFAVLLTNSMVMLTRYRQFRFAADLMYTMSTRLLAHYLAQPYAFTLTRNSSTLTNTVMTQINRITSGVGTGLHLMSAGVSIVAIVALLVALDPLLALASFGVLATLYGAIYLATRRYLTRTSRELVAVSGVRFKALSEAMGGFKDLKVAGREADALRHYQVAARRQADIQAAVQAINALPRYALEAIAVGSVVVVASLVAGREGAFGATLPLLSAYVFGALRLLPAMQMFFAGIASLRNTLGAIEVVEDDLAQARESGDALAPPAEPLPFERTIALQGVTFRYPAGEGAALHGIDLELTKGRSLALVGRTGSGKTTLVNVLLGLLEASDGHVEVDGRRVTADDRRAYRRLFGYVPQDIFLTDDTIRRNVALGIPDDGIDDEAVRRACRQAQVDDFIEQELPDAYQTVVGERGIRLSGGQRQRIGIARALYHQPAVLVFDEATSALDVHTEKKVFEALDAIAKERTLVTIAHRLETVASADHVLVLEHGHVTDQGRPVDVLGRYREGSAAPT